MNDDSLVPPQEQQRGSLVAALAPHWEVAAYSALILVALLMRLWDLGSQAISFDEANHTLYSFFLSNGQGYQHNPLTHGPLQFHGIAAMFFLFGDGDYAARLLSAIFGTALVGIPFFLRHHLGRAGALVTATLLAFSPIMLFYSRYARNDIIMAVWTLALVVVLWRFQNEGKPRYLYLGALFLALAFTTKETTFIVVAILGSYLLIVAATDWIPWLFRRANPLRRPSSPDEGEYRYWPGYGYAFGQPRTPHRLSEFSRAGIFLVLLATLVIPQGSAAVAVLQDTYQSREETLQGRGTILAYPSLPEGQPALHPVGAPAGDVLFTIQDLDITKGMAIAAIIVIIALWFSALVGVSWSRSVWLRCAAIFYGVWLLLYTTFFTNMVGLGSGMWQSLGYWLAQQGVNRGTQPWYYYFVITPIYEMLPFLFSLVAVVYYVIRGSSFTRFLAYWVVLTFILYTVAGEKMPWLLVNVALPMIVLSGKFIGDILVAVPWRRVWRAGGLYLVPMTALLLYLALRLLLYRIERGNFLNFLEFWALLAVALTLVGLGIHLLLRSGVANGLRVVALSFALVLFVLAIRSGWQASYNNGDVPVEMIVYAQTSGDVPQIMEDVRAVAQGTGLGEDLRVTVDGMGTVFRWYMRDFRNVAYVNLKILDDAELSNMTQSPEGSVLLIGDGNKARLAPYIDGYAPGQDFLYLWWPAEGYKPCSDQRPEPCLRIWDVFGNLFSRDKWREGLDFFVYRETSIDFLFHRAVAYFPKGS